MQPFRDPPSPAEVAGEVGSLAAGLGILTTVLFPFALPLLLLVAAPLVVLAPVAVVFAAPVALGLWLARTVRRRLLRSRLGQRREAAPSPLGGARAA